jgi:hypothetical protein
LKELFVEGSSLPGADEKELLTMPLDDKSDGEYLVIEEEGGGVGMLPPPSISGSKIPGEDDDDEDSEKGEDVGLGWEDAYEQEV